VEGDALVSGRLNIQQLRPPVLRHQAEAQITICAKPGAHEAHMGRTWAYARRTPGAKRNFKIALMVQTVYFGHFPF
jgi:hypothetical protein